LVKKVVAKIFVCLVCFLLAKADAQTVSDLLQQGVSVRRAVIPLYPAGSFKLSAVVRVDRAYLDYQRKGFFRIGLFPIVVLEDVTFEAQDTANPAASLACVRHWLGTRAGQRIEMRRVKFLLSPTNCLEAGLARCVAEDRLELRNGVRFVSGAGEVRAPRATLEMAGPRTGQVILETVPRSTTAFLASALTFNDTSHPPITAPLSSK
jgi:hypothetical protein